MKIDFNSIKSQVVYFLKDRGPNIMIVGGVIGLVSSGIMACGATRTVEDVLDDHKKRISTVNREEKKELVKAYMKTGSDFARLYGPSVVIGGLSTAGILSGNHILRTRNVGLAAAYATIDGTFKQYRRRVAEKYGSEVDHEMRFGTHQEKIESTITDENGKEKKVKQTVAIHDGDISGYTRWFTPDESQEAQGNLDYDLFFLKTHMDYINQKLRAEKFIFLNEVLDNLGFPKTITGQHVGWVFDKESQDHGDNWIDFGIQVVRRLKPDGSGKFEDAILLEFNVDGPVFNHALENGLISE